MYDLVVLWISLFHQPNLGFFSLTGFFFLWPVSRSSVLFEHSHYVGETGLSGVE